MLPQVIRRSRADILISAGNSHCGDRRFLRSCFRATQSSLTGFFRDLRSRGEYLMWLDTRTRAILENQSIGPTLRSTPSTTFADELERWTHRKVNVIYHGFDRSVHSRFGSASFGSQAENRRCEGMHQDSLCKPLQLLSEFRDSDESLHLESSFSKQLHSAFFNL